jgi:hypothetical protein
MAATGTKGDTGTNGVDGINKLLQRRKGDTGTNGIDGIWYYCRQKEMLEQTV